MNITNCPKCHCMLEILPNTELKYISPKEVCSTCMERPPEWIRYTQFCGEHHFCDECAQKEKDFGKEEPFSFFWVNKNKKVKGKK